MKGKTLFGITVLALIALTFTVPIAVAQLLPDDANSPNLYTLQGQLNFYYEKRIQRGGVIVAQGGGHHWGPAPVIYTLAPIVSLPLGATVVDAFLYLSFDNLENVGYSNVELIPPSGPNIPLGDSFDHIIPPGTVSQYHYCTARFVVTNDIHGSGSYGVQVNFSAPSSVYGAMLIVVYQKLTAGPIAYVIIHDGCYWISNEVGTTEHIFLTLEPKVVVDGAYLTTMVQGAENQLYDELWVWGSGAPLGGGNAFNGESNYFGSVISYNNLWDVDRFDVTSLIRKGNNMDHPVIFKSITKGSMGPDGFIADVAMYDIYYHYPPVGGITFQPDKLALLAPYITLAALITIPAVLVAVYWRRRLTKA